MNANHSCNLTCNHRCVSKFSETLKKLREARGLTYTDIARVVGISRQAVSKWESGDSKNIRLDHLEAVCKFYGITIEQLLSGAIAQDAHPTCAEQTSQYKASEAGHSAQTYLYRNITSAFPSDIAQQFAALPEAGQQFVLAAIRATIKTATDIYGTQPKQTAA